MEEVKFKKLKIFLFKYNKIIIAFFLVILIIILFTIFKESYSYRESDYSFDEIQQQLTFIQARDFTIYNKTKVKEVNGVAKGIDVSSWQGEINWDQVAESGIDFAMIRCGFSSIESGEIKEDNQFLRNIKEANRVGIPVGIYYFSTAINEQEAILEASYVLNSIKDYKITYPIAYDFETFNKNRTQDVSDDIINNNALVFLNYIKKHGYKTMLYSNYMNIKNHWHLNLFNDYPIWYAQYIDKSTYEGEYSMWQYADNGRVSGIKGNVDLNESYIIYEEIFS